jgi:inhibitor of KinA sporulation pathway (predicted exonuclease)
VTWGKEDVSLLTNDCLRHQLEIDWLEPHLNLKKAFRNLRGLRKPLGLLKCLELEGFEFEGSHHRAIDDAINTVKIFRQHLDEWQY